MSATIDERVVEMRFDNKQFESNVQTSLSTLDKLKQALKLDGAAKGLENLGSSVKKCDMSTLGSSVEAVRLKFSALEVMAVTALTNITNSAINSGKQLVSSLTIDQVTAGWDKYADKTSAVQTIMAATAKDFSDTGEQMEYVNAQLNKLNWFTDETSYNFLDMVSNIGKFTSNNVSLDKSVTAMEGISVWAAKSGANVGEASRAMYNLSQAISVGAVKLMDWKSIENANMATYEFKQTAIDTAVAMGTLIDKGDGVYETLNGNAVSATNFNEALKDSWFTSDVLLQTLDRYGKFTNVLNEACEYTGATATEMLGLIDDYLAGNLDLAKLAEETGISVETLTWWYGQMEDETMQFGLAAFKAAQEAKTFQEAIDATKDAVSTGWMQTFELIFGNYEEAKVLWTDLANAMYDVFASGAEARNEMLTKALREIGKPEIISYISELTGMTEEAVQSLDDLGKSSGYTSDEFKEFASVLAEGDETMASVIANLLRMRDGNQDVVKYISNLTGMSEESVTELRKLGMETGYTSDEFKELASTLAEGDEAMEATITTLLKANELTGRELLIDSFWNAWEGIGNLVSEVKEAFHEIFPATTAEQINEFIRSLWSASERLKEFFALSEEGEPLNATFANIRSTFKGLFAILDIGKQAISAVFRAISPFAEKLTGLGSSVLGLTGSFGEWLVNLSKSLKENDTFYNGIQKVIEVVQRAIPIIRDFASAIGEKFHLPSFDQIKESIENLYNTIKGKFNQEGLDRIKGFIDRVKALDGISLENIRTALADFKDNVLDYFLDTDQLFENVKQRISGFAQAIKDLFDKDLSLGEKIDRIKQALGGFGESIENIFNRITSFANGAKNEAGSAFDSIVTFLSNAKDRIFGIALDIREKLADKIGFGEIFAIGIGAAMVAFTKKISDALGTLSSPIEGIGNLLKSGSKALNAFAMETKSKALLNVAAAILVLVGSLAILTLLDQEKLKGSLVVLGLLAGGLVLVSLAMSKMGNMKDMAVTAGMILSFGASILLLSKAMKTLEGLENAGKSLGIITVLIGELLIVSKLMGSKNSKSSASALSMIGFALSLKILVGVIKDIDDMQIYNVGKTIGIMLGAVASLALLGAACKNVSLGSGVGLLAMVVSLKLLIGAFEDLAEMDIGKMRSSLEAFAGIFGMFAVVLVASRFAGENASKAGTAILKMSASLLLIVAAFKMMEGIDPAALERTKQTVSDLLLVFAAVTAASMFAGENASKAGSMLLLMSGAILILSAAMALLAHLDPSGLDRALGAVTQLLLVFGVLVGVSAFAGEASKAQGTLITLTVAIALLTASVAALSFLDPERLQGATTALTVLMTALSLLVASTGLAGKATGTIILLGLVVAELAVILAAMCKLDVQPSIQTAAALSILLLSLSAAMVILGQANTVSAKTIGVAALLGAVVAELAVVLGVMAHLNVEPSIQTAAALSILLLSLSASMVVLSASNVTAATVGMAALMGLVVAELAVVLGVMSALNVEPSIETAEALSILLLSLSAACVILGVAGMAGAAAFVGIGALATLIAAIGGIMAAISALTKDNPTVEADLDRAIMVMEKIGSGLGAVLGGFLEGLTTGLPGIGENLSGFMDNLQPFLDGARSIDSSVLDGVKSLGEAIAIISGADLLQGITSWLIGDSSLADFGNQLVPFGTAIKDFAAEVDGLNADVVTNAANAGKAIAEMASELPNSGGLAGAIFGENDMGTFGSQLKGFGTAIKDFAAEVDGLNADVVDNAANAGKAVAEMASALPNSGGWAGEIFGENDMADFAAQLVPFGTAIKDFATEVDGLESDVVTNATNAGSAIAELASSLPNSGGWAGKIFGENDMSAFAEQLVPFGTAIKDFATEVDGLESDVVTNATNAGTAIAKLAASLPNSGGVVSWFTGDNKMDDFGTQLTEFGKGMKAYSDSLTGFKTETVNDSINAATALSQLASGLPDSGGVMTWFVGDNKMDTFGNQLIKFGEGMKSYSDSLDGFSSETVNASVEAAGALSALASGLPTSGLGDQNLTKLGADITKFGTSLQSFNSKVSGINADKINEAIAVANSIANLAGVASGIDPTAFSNFGTALSNLLSGGFVDALDSVGDQIDGAVVGMINNISDLITQNQNMTDSAMQTIIISIAGVIVKQTPTVVTAGTAMMTAFVTVIRNSSGIVRAAVVTVMSSAISSINSYRSSFYNAGWNVGQGFVQGISSQLSNASAAGRRLGLAALNAAKQALDSHSPSREFIYLGENIGAGLAIGVDNGIVPAAKATSELIGEVISVSQKGIDAWEDWLDEKKYYNEISLKDELAGWENLQKKYAAGSEERKKIDREVYRVQNELVEATYQFSIDWIEKEKYYNRLSTKEELEAYERMQKRYMWGSEERKKIDREIYRLRNQLVDESYQNSMNWIEREKYYNRLSLEEELAAYERVQARYKKGTEEWENMEREKYRVRNEIVDASYQNSMNWIEQEKYYNRMSLADELAAYKRVQSRYAKGTDEYKKMAKEIYRVENEIVDAQKEYASEVQRVQSEANQKRLDLEQEYADKVKSINEKLASDIESENNRYLSALESRTNTLYNSYGLFDEVKEREEVSGDTLMKNLEDQVKEFGEWQDIVNRLSARGLTDEMIEELQQMGPSSISQIKALENMSTAELNKYVSLWSIKHAQARDQAVGELEGLRIETLNNISKLRADAASELEEYRGIWLRKLQQVNDDADAELERLREEFGKKVGLIKTDTEAEMEDIAETAQKILTEAGWDETGQKIVGGLADGVKEGRSAFLEEITELALAAVEAAEETLDIHSPSRVFWRIGNLTGLGFINGLRDYADKSYDAGAEMADSAAVGLSDVLQNISDLIDGGLEMEPTIRPVLDLTDITRGADEIDSLFASQRAWGLAGQVGLTLGSDWPDDQMTITVDTDGVIQELRSLRGDMSDLMGRMERLQVVLDTGELVGGIAEPMNEALGQRQIRAGRGI